MSADDFAPDVAPSDTATAANPSTITADHDPAESEPTGARDAGAPEDAIGDNAVAEHDEHETAAAAFAALGLRPELCDALAALGYEEPTPIQREAIPVLLSGRDVLGLAATGTGKTAAFALPMLQRIAEIPRDEGARGAAPRALILVPTRELCMQVAEAVHKYGRSFRTRVLAVYGGAAMSQQLRALERGVDVVVGTPGRALDHINRKALNLSQVKVLVLDEADEMLDMGFEEDLTAIVGATPTAGRQTAMFSATMAPRVARAGDNYLQNPARVEVARQALAAGEMPKVRQTAYLVPRAHKVAALGRVLDMEQPTSAIVFCRTRTEADALTETLAARGFGAEALHGGMGQEARDRVMRRFRGGQVELLIATDVAARGLDVDHVSHVVNYDVPSAPDAYVHRIGRTGRAGREGAAITIAEPRERGLLRNIERVTKQRLDLAPVPTSSDIKARRFERTATLLRDALTAAQGEQRTSSEGQSSDDGDDTLAPYRAVAEMLAGEFDLADVAAAAVRLAHDAAGNAPAAEDEVEIPSFHEPAGRPRDRDRGPDRGREERSGRGDSARGPVGRAGAGRGDAGRGDEGGEGGRDAGRAERPRREPARGGSNTRLYVGVGRRSGVRPGDLVGAIANEAGIDASKIGAINIAERFAIVEVPAGDADAVMAALRETTIRGERPVVRLDDGTNSYPPRSETVREYDRAPERGAPSRERFGGRGGSDRGTESGEFPRGGRGPRDESQGGGGGGRFFDRGERAGQGGGGGYPRPRRDEGAPPRDRSEERGGSFDRPRRFESTDRPARGGSGGFGGGRGDRFDRGPRQGGPSRDGGRGGPRRGRD